MRERIGERGANEPQCVLWWSCGSETGLFVQLSEPQNKMKNNGIAIIEHHQAA